MIKEKKFILSKGIYVVSCCLALLFLPAVGHSQQGSITLIAEDGAGPPGSTANPVLIILDNPDDDVRSISFDICRGSYITLSNCSSTSSTTGLGCSTQDLGNGCDRILFLSFGSDFIAAGTGPIITLEYDVSVSAPDPSLGFCESFDLQNVTIVSCVDDGSGGCLSGPPFDTVTLVPGEFCYINPPSCLGVSPDSGMQGDKSQEVTIVGENTNFAQGVTVVSFQNLGITVTSVTIDSPTQLRATIDIAKSASTGLGDVTVTTGTEVVVCPNAFEVLPEVIFCLDVSPGSGLQDAQDVEVTITGSRTHFEQGITEVNFANPGITVTTTVVDSPTQVRVFIDIQGNAFIGPDDVTVTSGLESVVCFDAFEVLEKIIEITELRESNPTSTSFTISWVTDSNSNGEVHYSIDPGFSDFETAYDDRGQFHLDDTHHVSLGNLLPETTYYYEVKSGGTVDNNGGLYYSFSTMKIPIDTPPHCPVYGWAYLGDGVTPAEGTIAYLKLVHAGVDSYWLSALVDASGVWMLNLDNLFSTLTDDVLFYSTSDPVVLNFQSGSGSLDSAQFTVPAVCPLNAGTIILERFINVEKELHAGFNLIAFPFDPITNENFEEITYTACGLINDIPGCNQAFSWNPISQSWLFAEDVGGVCIGTNFSIEAGKGYFLQCDSDAITSFYGKVISSSLSLTFEPGFNLFAIPYPGEYYTACSLFDSIPSTSRAFSWDLTLQKWLSALNVGGLCIGDDFSVEDDKGYIIYSETHIDEWVPIQ